MNLRSGIRAGIVTLAGPALLALFALAPIAARAADATAFDTNALANQTRRLLNDAGQFYMAWWLPEGLTQVLMRDAPNIPQPDKERALRALQPYVVFAVSRGQEGASRLEDLHDRSDLLKHSRLAIDGLPITAAPDPSDPGVQAALDMLRPVLAAMLGRNGYGIEFALYQQPPGTHAPDPALGGKIEYTLYRKQLVWKLPVWASLAATPAPVQAPVQVQAPAAPPVFVPVPVHAAPAPAPGPVPVRHRKVDPTTGEEFPERYDYNPYTGQKLVSQ
jgi:hypothetical protein